MTKKDRIKEDILNLLNTRNNLVTREIFLHITEKLEHQLSLSTLRRYLKELVQEHLIYSKESTTADKNKSVWSLVESNLPEEQETKPEPTPEPEKADTPTEEKDIYEKAIKSANEVLSKGIAAKITEQFDNESSNIVWIIYAPFQLKAIADRWQEMKSANYTRIKDIKVEATEEPVQPDLETEPENNQKISKKPETKRYNMDERFQMKKFFNNLGAEETRAIELVKDVISGRNTEEKIEKTLREEKQATIGLLTPKTQDQRVNAQLKSHDQLVSNFTSILKMNKNVASKIAFNLIKRFKINDIPLININEKDQKDYEEIHAYLTEVDKLKEQDACKLAIDLVLGWVKNTDAEVKKIKKSYEQAAPTPKKKAVPTPKKKAAPTPKKKRYTRANALAEAINGGAVTDIDRLIEKSNELYVKNGGKDNVKESKWFANYGLSLLECMGILEWKENGKAFFNHLTS